MWEEGAGELISGPLINSSSQTVLPFQFPFIVLLHSRGAFFNFNPCWLFQLQSLLPTSPLIAFNFNPRCELRTMCGSRTGGWSLSGVMSD
jgi:hypothetical protein